MNKLKERNIEVLYDSDGYPIEIRKTEDKPKFEFRYSDIFYIVAVLAMFVMVGPDLGYLFGVAILIGVAVLGWYMTLMTTGNRLASILGGLLLMAVVMASNLDDNLMANIMRLSMSLQRTSLILIIVGAVILGTLPRRK